MKTVISILLVMFGLSMVAYATMSNEGAILAGSIPDSAAIQKSSDGNPGFSPEGRKSEGVATEGDSEEEDALSDEGTNDDLPVSEPPAS